MKPKRRNRRPAGTLAFMCGLSLDDISAMTGLDRALVADLLSGRCRRSDLQVAIYDAIREPLRANGLADSFDEFWAWTVCDAETSSPVTCIPMRMTRGDREVLRELARLVGGLRSVCELAEQILQGDKEATR